MSYITYSYENLKTFCRDAFMKFGFTEEEALKITDVLLLSDLYGIESHGMQRLVRYHKGIEKGLIKVDAKPETVFETPVSAVIDGHDGMGQLISIHAMNMAVEKAKNKLEEQIENKDNILKTYINYNETEEFVEAQVIYEVLEEIGTKEKIVF